MTPRVLYLQDQLDSLYVCSVFECSCSKLNHHEAAFAKALKTKDGQTLPQAIAHRGYKAKYPENSMAAFKGALAAGAHALETDIHLTKDGVVVLSHVGYYRRQI